MIVPSGMRILHPILFLFALPIQAQYWQQMEDFPGTARDDAAAFAIDTKIYVGTGYQNGWVLATDWFAYDIVGLWTGWGSVAPLPSTPRQYCTGIDGGYLFGGLDANGPLNELWKYNPSTNSWSQLSSLPAPGRYAASTFTLNGRIFVANGMLSNGIPTNEFWEYDPILDTWIQRASVPGPARHRACSFINHLNNQTHGFVAGGADSAFIALQDVWGYDGLIDVWAQVASLPEARYGAGAAYVLGGSSVDGPTLIGGAINDSTFHSNGYLYVDGVDSWTDLGQLIPRGVRGGAMASASGGGGWNMTIFGTGIDSTLIRRQEVYSTFQVFGIAENGRSPISVHPNPGTTTFTLQLPATIVKADLVVHDLSGRMILSTPLLSSTVDASDWPSGSYIIQVTSANGDRYRAHWVKL